MTPPTTRRTRPVLVTLSVVAMAATAALPASAAPNEVVYDALGDSYAAGSGASTAYAYVLDGRMKIALDDFAAVGGATVPTMLTGQLDALDPDTDLVTVSIGGNDIGWGDVVQACVAFDEPMCQGAVAQTAQLIQTALPGLLHGAYSAVRTEAPDAHVVVTGYPRLFSPEFGDYAPFPGAPLMLTVEEQQMLNDGADLLNQVTAGVAQQHGFQFVDVTRRFTGHGVNAPDAWLTDFSATVPLHPTDQGQHAYGVALTSQINPRSLR